MSDYLFDRGYPFIDEISAEHARALYDRAAARPDAQLEGTFEKGFSYVVTPSAGGVNLVRCSVRPRDAEPPR
jgi:hypothetical protein